MELLSTRVRYNRRYLVQVMGNLTQCYKSDLSLRLHKLNECDQLLSDLEAKPSMEVG